MNAPASPPTIRTTCPYCGVGCGVLAKPDGFGGAEIEGDTAHPANFGRLCSKGSALGETLSLDGRLLHPMVKHGGGPLVRSTWDEAISRVAKGFLDTIERHGPGSAAFYVSGQLLTEDYYVANKLMKGFIGSANIDTNSRLCMASSVAGHKRAFGADTVPGSYDDLEQADLLVLVGSNAAWCHPVLYQRMIKNRRERGARIVIVDPRHTATSEEADLSLRLAPGTDSVLFSGLLAYLSDSGALDRSFISRNTDGFAEALAKARHNAPDIDTVAERCGLPQSDLEAFFHAFLTTEKTVTLYSQGVNQSAQGTDKVNAIINCHLATGRIGKEGTGPFSLTGQPNAMGGREVGGLANQLAAHMSFDSASLDRVERFWKAPKLAKHEGLKAVDLMGAVAAGHIKALWVMGTNPAVSMPRADAVRDALRQLNLFVVSDIVASNDTITAGAHVLLPAAGWGEKDGTVTNSERRISRQRAFMKPPGDAKPDWWIVTEVARKMGNEHAFPYRSAADIFEEHARLSAFENNGTRDFDIGGLINLTPQAYDDLEPVQWPLSQDEKTGVARLFADGGFFTPNRRAQFIAVARPQLAAERDRLHSLILNTGRVRDQWHTMTRTGKSPRLGAHIEEPFISVHPTDAQSAKLSDGGFARLSAAGASAILRVRVTEDQRPGEVFAPIHWNGETASAARIGALVQSANDPVSGQPELKATPVGIAPVSYDVHGFLLSRNRLEMPDNVWWARTAVEGGHGLRLAITQHSDGLPAMVRTLIGGGTRLVEYSDSAQGLYRAAVLSSDDRLETCIFLASDPARIPDWGWLKRQLSKEALEPQARRAVLAGRLPEGASATGPIVCACFGVGLCEIEALIATGETTTTDAIGAKLKAGTNCGSCLPEMRKLIKKTAADKPEPAPVG
jgi:assimilatory nitrate reductase catalytic subunit